MQTASLGSVVKRSVPAASKGQVVCMGEFFLLQILTLNLLLSNIAVDSTIGDFCICVIFVPLVFLSVKSQKGRGARGGRGMVLMAEKYLLFNFLNIQRDVTEKE